MEWTSIRNKINRELKAVKLTARKQPTDFGAFNLHAGQNTKTSYYDHFCNETLHHTIEQINRVKKLLFEVFAVLSKRKGVPFCRAFLNLSPMDISIVCREYAKRSQTPTRFVDDDDTEGDYYTRELAKIVCYLRDGNTLIDRCISDLITLRAL